MNKPIIYLYLIKCSTTINTIRRTKTNIKQVHNIYILSPYEPSLTKNSAPSSPSCSAGINHHRWEDMKGTISDEIEVNVPANVAWELYGTLHLSRFIVQELPTLLNKVDVIEGDGSTGTVLKITFPEGTPGIPYFKERFNIVDNEKRYKQSQVIEGGYVDIGYTFYGIRFEVNEKDENSCITKFTVSYEVEDVKLASHAFTMVEPLQTVIRSAKTYLTNKTHN